MTPIARTIRILLTIALITWIHSDLWSTGLTIMLTLISITHELSSHELMRTFTDIGERINQG